MRTIGAELTRVTRGIVEIEMPFSPALTQQHGFLHAGVISAALDSACGYAAFSLMPADAAVLTIEFKVNLLAPGKGERFLFIANRVLVEGGLALFLVPIGKEYNDCGHVAWFPDTECLRNVLDYVFDVEEIFELKTGRKMCASCKRRKV